MDSPNSHHLDTKQWGSLCDLLVQLRHCVSPDALRTRNASEWDWSNVFGIVGPRGSGKSTVLRKLYELLTSRPAGPGATAPPTPECVDGDGGDPGEYARCLARRLVGDGTIHVVEPLDCSALPEQVDPASAVLLRVAVDARLWSSASQVDPARKARLIQRLKDLAGAHMKGSTSYGELCLELSTTPDELPQYLIEGIEKRFGLQRQLLQWFHRTAKILGLQCVIVPLDDFDLVPGPTVRRWLQALLDTLRQPRLAFVLTADLQRLEHISIDPETEIDEATGHALLLKLLPALNRHALEPFGYDQRLAFQSYSSSTEPLNDRFEDHTRRWQPWRRQLVRGLIPAWPRGLVNFYDLLTAHSQTGEGAPSSAASLTDLAGLATSRGETLLARRLCDTTPAAWLDEMLDPERRGENERGATQQGDTAHIVWQQTVAAAGSSQVPSPPLLALPPIPVVRRPHRGRDPMSHNPRWGDPLRNDDRHDDSLRDARPDDQRALWAELIVNTALADNGGAAESLGAQQRAVLLTRWAPLRRRTERSCFQVEFSGDELVRFLTSPPPLFDRAMLPWLRWTDERVESTDRFTLSIGWSVLLRHLQGGVRPWPARLLGTLRVAPGNLAGELRLPPPETALRVLPAEVRHMILLVDALDRCPWEALSAPRLGWAPLTYVRLATELVRTAYVSTLLKLGLVDAAVAQPHERLLGALARLDPGFAQGDAGRGRSLREADVMRLLDETQDAGLREALAARSDALSQAATAFLGLDAYNTVERVFGAWA